MSKTSHTSINRNEFDPEAESVPVNQSNDSNYSFSDPPSVKKYTTRMSSRVMGKFADEDAGFGDTPQDEILPYTDFCANIYSQDA